MKNKKGFTLIELLAVIVILAIIMVIAVPQILNVINNSRKSSWSNHVKLVAKAVETNDNVLEVSPSNDGLNGKKFIFGKTYDGCDKTYLQTTADIDTTSSYISVSSSTNETPAEGRCVFTVYPTGSGGVNGQFTATGNVATKITCTRGVGCKYILNQ